MNSSNINTELFDNGGRRSGIERREFSYSGYYPERRKGQDRRCGMDRRSQREGQQIETDGNYSMRATDRRSK